MTKRFGFTLAEVLITLAIIGVVAALTLPALLNSTRGAELKTGFKKEFAAMASIPKLSYAHDGTDFSNWDADEVVAQFQDSFDVVKTETTYDKDALGLLAEYPTDLQAATYLVLNDGAILIVPDDYSKCTYDASAATPGAETGCLVYIDANGVNGPNKIIGVDDATTVTDIYPVIAGGMFIRPGNAAAQAVFENQKKLDADGPTATFDANKVKFTTHP